MNEDRFRWLKDLLLFPVLILMVIVFTIVLVLVEYGVRVWSFLTEGFRKNEPP